MSYSDILAKMHALAPGEHIVYHQGFLVSDIGSYPGVTKLAAEAWSLYLRGKAHLTQRRVTGPNGRILHYEYIITGASDPRAYVPDQIGMRRPRLSMH